MGLFIIAFILTGLVANSAAQNGIGSMIPAGPFDLMNLVYVTIVLLWAVIIMRVVVWHAERDYIEELRRERDRLAED